MTAERAKTTEELTEELTNHHLRLLIGDLFITIAQLRAENDVLKAGVVTQPTAQLKSNGRATDTPLVS